MSDADELLERITRNPEILGGKPTIRGKRLAVEHIFGMLSAGDSAEELLQHYPWLERDDIRACFLYAARALRRERMAETVDAK